MEGKGKSIISKGDSDMSGITYRIVIASLGCEFPCRADQSVLAAMVAAGKHSLPVGCRSGGCGVCRIQVTDGRFRTGFMNRSIVTVAEEQSGLLLACRTFPQSDMRLEPRPVEQRATAPRTDMAA